MTSLIDVVPATTDVPIQGGKLSLKVSGLSLEAIASLIEAFPLVSDLFAGKLNGESFSPKALVAAVPGLLSASIAAASGHPGEPEWIKAAANLAADDQAALFEAILKLTMPEGVGPFVARVTRALGVVAGDEEESSKGPASNTPKQPSS
jgi:hypothetical protein